MDKLNPFPDFPVVNLKGALDRVRKDTIATPAIVEARKSVVRYGQQWLERKVNAERPVEPMIIAVKGDYGTGKTHLLLDAAAQLQDTLGNDFQKISIFRIACLETDPLTWFRLGFAPELNPVDPMSERGLGPIPKLLLELYAEAGRTIAGNVKLTEGAVSRLIEKPEAIRTLIKEQLLNGAAVDEEFDALLKRVCPEASDDVRRAFAATVWADTEKPSLHWLMGGSLEESQRKSLRLSEKPFNEDDAAQIIVALAAIHDHLKIPFVLMIDELEHLTFYDEAQHNSRNVTWLKRLVEQLAGCKILGFVSGHWSGWAVRSDVLARLSQGGTIEIVKITPDDLLRIVQARVSNLDEKAFDKSQAAHIVSISDGNIRRCLTICQMLFRQTNGFERQVTPEMVEQAVREIEQRLTPEAAISSIRALLKQQGLNVQTQSATGAGIPFDLIGYQDKEIRIVVDLKHAVLQSDLHDQAQVFLERVWEVCRTAPDLVACFVADGNIDDNLLRLLRKSHRFKLLWYDLNEKDVMKRIASDLQIHLHEASNQSAASDTHSAALAAQRNQNEERIAQLEQRIATAGKDANAALVAQLQEQRNLAERQIAELTKQMAERESYLRDEFLRDLRKQAADLDAKRSAELHELRVRLEEERRAAQSEREKGVLREQEGEVSPKLHATFADLTRPQTFTTKLRMAMSGPNALIAFAFVVTGIAMAFSAGTIVDTLGVRTQVGSVYRGLLYVAGLLISCSGIFLVGLRLAKVETFLSYSARTLREIYIRSESVQALVRADNILRDSLENHGLIRWKDFAEERLWREFGPEMLGTPPQYLRGAEPPSGLGIYK